MKDYQSILFPYAYNILGSSEDAKDAVQDVLYKYLASPREGIENEKNYLIRSVVNRSIDIKNSKKKIVPDDVWLPEPIATEKADTDINLSDIVTYSLMVLMEQLNPKERAVFILKEGFGYSHGFYEYDIRDDGTVNSPEQFMSTTEASLKLTEKLALSASLGLVDAISFQGVSKVSQTSGFSIDYTINDHIATSLGVSTDRPTQLPDGQSDRVQFLDPTVAQAFLDIVIGL